MRTTTDERADFGAGLRSYLERAITEAEVRRLIDAPANAGTAVWDSLQTQFSLGALTIPEESGGQGLGLTELVVALAEGARTLLPVPVLSHSLAALALRLADGDEAQAVLRELASGRVAALPLDLWSPDVELVARQGEAGWSVTGVVARVGDPEMAEILVVPAVHDDQTGLFVIELAARGVSTHPLTTLDLTRRESEVSLDHAPATLVARSFSDSTALIDAAASVMASAEILGVSEKAFEIAVAYAKERHQFGVPIGSFQAVKHMLAESFAAVEMLRAGVATGAEAIDQVLDDPTEAQTRAIETGAVVKAYASVHGPKVVETLIQVLGGIGYTWEHAAHLYLRRARSLAQQYGTARDQRAILASEFGLVTA